MKKLFDLINRNFFFDKLGEMNKSKRDKDGLPLITISREKGSGGRPIAHLVAKKLGKPWKVFHEQIVDEIAKETHLEKNLIKDVDENNIPLVEEVIADFFGKRYLNLGSYHKHLVKILSTIGQRGYAIIVGRGAQYLFPQALNVRMICQMPQRIKWEMKYENLTEKEAIKRITLSDRQRQDFEMTVFDHDICKAHHYDLVIRTGSNFSIEDAAELIVTMAKRRFKL